MTLGVGPRATPMPKAIAMEVVIINRKILISIAWVFFCFVMFGDYLLLVIGYRLSVIVRLDDWMVGMYLGTINYKLLMMVQRVSVQQ